MAKLGLGSLVVLMAVAVCVLVWMIRSVRVQERQQERTCQERKCETGQPRFLRQHGEGCSKAAYDVCVCVTGAEWIPE